MPINFNTQDCCEACKIGLVVGSSPNLCSLEPFTFGNPWDDVYKNCCNEMKADDSFVLTEEEESMSPQMKLISLISYTKKFQL